MSAQQLADRCAELGMPSLNRAIITKLENGRREAVGTGELMVLAMALDIAPTLLLFPLGQERETGVTPANSMPTWGAVRWFYGIARPHTDTEVFDSDSDNPVALFETHDHLIGICERLRDSEKPSIPNFSFPEELAAHIGEMKYVRSTMRNLGLIPPEVPPEFPQIDNDAWPSSVSQMLADTARARRSQ